MSSKARDVTDRVYIGPAKAREASGLRLSSCHPGNSNESHKSQVLTLGTAKVLASHP